MFEFAVNLKTAKALGLTTTRRRFARRYGRRWAFPQSPVLSSVLVPTYLLFFMGALKLLCRFRHLTPLAGEVEIHRSVRNVSCQRSRPLTFQSIY